MRNGKLNCPKKNIWCIWTGLDNGECTKDGGCDVGTEAWKERKQEQERKMEENRRRAAERMREEDPTPVRKVFQIPDKHQAADPELSELIRELQRTEERMTKAYKTGKEGFGDRLYREALEIKQKIKERKSEK